MDGTSSEGPTVPCGQWGHLPRRGGSGWGIGLRVKVGRSFGLGVGAWYTRRGDEAHPLRDGGHWGSLSRSRGCPRLTTPRLLRRVGKWPTGSRRLLVAGAGGWQLVSRTLVDHGLRTLPHVFQCSAISGQPPSANPELRETTRSKKEERGKRGHANHVFGTRVCGKETVHKVVVEWT